MHTWPPKAFRTYGRAADTETHQVGARSLRFSVSLEGRLVSVGFGSGFLSFLPSFKVCVYVTCLSTDTSLNGLIPSLSSKGMKMSPRHVSLMAEVLVRLRSLLERSFCACWLKRTSPRERQCR